MSRVLIGPPLDYQPDRNFKIRVETHLTYLTQHTPKRNDDAIDNCKMPYRKHPAVESV